MADPGFPVGGAGRAPIRGGCGPPTWALFGENVCKNERIGSHRGRAPGTPPLDPPMIVEQPGNPRCPVASFEKYLSKLDRSINILFQQLKKNIHPDYTDCDIWYHKKVVGKETIAAWLKTISTQSRCSQIYTNHCLHYTTVAAMKKSENNYSIPDIVSVIGHRNYQT